MRIIRLTAIAAAGLASLTCLGAMAQNNGPLQTPQAPPTALIATPRQDRHDGLSISVDPYNEPARAKEKFGKANPLAVGILPIEVSMHNDTERPIRVDLSTIQLEVHFSDDHHQEIDWLPPQQVANQVVADNATIASVCASFANCHYDNGAAYNAVFTTSDVTTRDYFHPSVAGQTKAADAIWGAFP